MAGHIWPAHIGLGWQPTGKTGEGHDMADGANAGLRATLGGRWHGVNHGDVAATSGHSRRLLPAAARRSGAAVRRGMEQRHRLEHGVALGLARRRNEVGFLLWGHDGRRIRQRTRGQSRTRGGGGLSRNRGHGWL
jgi:hypothetical protein